jgi:ribosomal-protein-alanine N-acetyltransferase
VQFEQALTDTVILREARVGDAAALAAAHRRNREHLAPWDPERPPSFFEPAGQLRCSPPASPVPTRASSSRST